MTFEIENIEVVATTKTPFLRLNKDDGTIEISGISIPENTREFYWKFNRWLAEYSLNPQPTTKVKVALIYMNSSSSVIITRMLRLLDSLVGLKSEVEIDWYYESEDLEMRDIGQHYYDTMKCKINLHEVDQL